jgi:DtxR family manganese transport transcriptional regulator
MKIPRRDRLKIYGDLLSVLNVQANSEKIVLTRIQVQVNVPFDRLMSYISELKDLGLIQNEPDLILTEKGKQYLSEYGKVIEFMKRMGLTYQ